jgi:hypothetical protein
MFSHEKKAALSSEVFVTISSANLAIRFIASPNETGCNSSAFFDL